MLEERERRSFKKASYWGIKASLVKDNVTFETKLFSLNGQRISNGSDFDEQTGKLKQGNKSLIIGEEKVNDLLKTFSSEDWLVSKIEKSHLLVSQFLHLQLVHCNKKQTGSFVCLQEKL